MVLPLTRRNALPQVPGAAGVFLSAVPADAERAALGGAEKKSKVLALKRKRNERVLTKAKFLCFPSEETGAAVGYQIKSPQVLADILMQVDVSL